MSTSRVSILAAAAAVAGMAFAGTASAISIDFSTPSIDLTGGAVTDTITISGLTAADQAVTGYDLFVDFDDTALSAGTITQTGLPDDDLLGGPGATVTGGVIELFDFSPDGDASFAGQGDTYVIGSITFTPLGGGTGTSSPSFDLVDSQVTGLEDGGCFGGAPAGSCPYPDLLTFTSGTTSVPEPSTLALIGLGLGAVGLVSVRRRRLAVRSHHASV